MKDTSGQMRKLCPEDYVNYIFTIQGKWGGGKDHLLLHSSRDIRLTSLAPPSYQVREYLTLLGQTSTVMVLIQIRRRVVPLF